MPNPNKMAQQTDTGTAQKKIKKLKKKTTEAQESARPIARQTTKTNDGKGTVRTELIGSGERVSSEGSAGQTFGKTHHYTNPEAGENYYPGQFFPLGNSASGGKGGTVGKKSDPFLAGFNSDTTTSISRPYKRGRRNRG